MQELHDSYGPIPGYHSSVPASCTQEDAVRYLMYWIEHISIPFYALPEHPTSEDLDFYNDFSAFTEMRVNEENAEADYLEAKYEKLSPKDIAGKLAEFEECKSMLSKSQIYLCYIIDELAKSGHSALRIVPATSEKPQSLFITSISLMEWAIELQGRQHNKSVAEAYIPSEAKNKISSKQVIMQPQEPDNQINTDHKPWLIPDSRDPEAEYKWYIPARFFARELVRENPTLANKRELLATQVANLLKNVGINKRGQKKPFNPNTILKAFSNVSFG